jgi:hypothetical protein
MAHIIRDLFANNIDREIEEVIKVDQADEEVIKFEIDEYVVTDAIAKHYEGILDRYAETPNKPHEGIAIWVSGFFGSGKSSFAKMLGLSIENRVISGQPAGERFGARTTNKVELLLTQIAEKIPTHAVIFDVSTDRGIRSGSQTLTEIMYRLFLGSLGYAKDLDLAELEIGLESDGRLEAFEAAFQEVSGSDWNVRKGIVAFAMSEASAAMQRLQPEVYPTPTAWSDGNKGKADINPGQLAKRVSALIARRKPGHSVMFVIDEVGQFVAHDVQKMLDLQAVVQQLGIEGRGKHWVTVTSQEKLGELVGGLDDRKIELARLMDRFPSQVHLEPSDISEVTSKRVLAKNAAAQAELGALFDARRGRLTDHTRLSADIRLPELTRDGFVDLYPLLPYQVDLIIQVVSGLRTQGGANKHVGGANRTIIKLAQQLLIHPEVAIADETVGALARLDQIYDLVQSNIASEVRAKVAQISEQVDHPMASAVAKAICLLQFVQSVHRTPENIAASLYPSVDAPSQLESVRAALRALEDAHLVRESDDGYRIPTPAEDDWDRTRNGISPKPSDTKRLHRELLVGFWKPQPTFTLQDVKPFKAALIVDGREEEKGDLPVSLELAEEGPDFERVAADLRTRSQQDESTIYWAVPLNAAIDRETVELFRSREMEQRKARDARTVDESALIGEERTRGRRHQSELQRQLRTACLAGSAYFKGNDRSPDGKATDVGKAAQVMLGQVLPEVFTSFGDGAAKAGEVKRGFDALLVAADLQGLPAIFSSLGLLRDEGGKTVFDTAAPSLHALLADIEHSANYGQKETGRSLAEKFGRAPYGWDFDVVRVLVGVLVRAGAIQMTHKGNVIETTTSVAAKDALSNNNNFRAASFQPKKGVDFADVAKAAENFKETFGTAAKELSASSVAAELRQAITERQEGVHRARDLLVQHRLPGGAVLDDVIAQMRAIDRGTEEVAISEFNSSHQTIKEGIRRANEVNAALTSGVIDRLAEARSVLSTQWPFLDQEADLDDSVRDAAEQLADLLARETFFREIAEIDRARNLIEDDHARRFGVALADKVAEYQAALEQLASTPGWGEVAADAKHQIASGLNDHANDDGSGRPSISQLRSDREACVARLQRAIHAVHQVKDGDRIATVDAKPFFLGGVDDVEQLEAALTGLREECERLIADGKKIVIR